MTKLDELKAMIAAALLPWKFREEFQAFDGDAASGTSDTAYTRFSIIAADKSVVHEFYDPNCLGEDELDAEEARCRLIVDAVNALPALIAAVEALHRSLNWLASYPGGGTLGKDGPYEQARTALAPFGENDEQKD